MSTAPQSTAPQSTAPHGTPEDENGTAEAIAERRERERVRKMKGQRRAFKLALQRVSFHLYGTRRV